MPTEKSGKSMLSAIDFEREISFLAYMCQFAAAKKIPFELFINIRVPGPLQIVRLEPGEGKEHLVKVLEALARIDIASMTAPPGLMLAKIDAALLSVKPFIIFAGIQPYGSEWMVYIDRWKKRGGQLHQIVHTDTDAYLKPLSSIRRASS
jgi:hypothetical protein